MTCNICNGHKMPFTIYNDSRQHACIDCCNSIRQFPSDFLNRPFMFAWFKPIETFVPHAPTDHDIESNRKCIMCKQYSYFCLWGKILGNGVCATCCSWLDKFVDIDLRYNANVHHSRANRRINAAIIIQRTWRHITTNPKYVTCHRIQLHRLHKINIYI